MAVQDPNVSTESNGGALVVTSCVFLALSWLSVFLRTYVRAIMLKGFQLDDWLMIVAQLNYTISCGFILVGVYYGMGHHNKALDQFHEIEALKYQALATATYITNMMFIKLSIGIFLLRLATQKRYRYLIYGSIFIVTIWSVVLFFWNLFQCHPLAAQWDYTILEKDSSASCVSVDEIVNAAYALSVMTVISDWFYALIPIPMVWKVKMTKQAKMTVIAILGLGVFASVATLIRLKFLADLTNLDDLLFATTDTMVWTLIEPGVAIIASSLVTIRPLLRAWKIKGFQSTGQSKRTGTFSYGRQGSRTTRSNGAGGFGSKNRATSVVVDVEAGQGKKDTSTSSSTSPSSASASSPSSELGPARYLETRWKTSHMMPRITERAVESPRPTPDDDDDTRSLRSAGEESEAGRRARIHSEMYIIEGAPTPSPRLPGQAVSRDTWPSGSASSSEVELARMEPVYSQSDGRVGLGSPTWRR